MLISAINGKPSKPFLIKGRFFQRVPYFLFIDFGNGTSGSSIAMSTGSSTTGAGDLTLLATGLNWGDELKVNSDPNTPTTAATDIPIPAIFHLRSFEQGLNP